MHLQVIEPYLGGHHSNYLEALIPAFERALAQGSLTRVTITVTQAHYVHLQQNLGLDVSETGISFDNSFPFISPAPSLRDRVKLFRAMNRSVELIKPDHLIVPSADYDVMVQAFLRSFVRFGLKTNISATGIIHYGMPLDLAASSKESIKQRIYQMAWRFSRWNTLMMVNPLMYERIIQNSHYKKRLQVLPDPVPAAVKINKADARASFGLAKEAFFFGSVGVMDERKAIPEMLAAYASLKKIKDNVKLVLIGQLSESYRVLINHHYQQFVDSDDLIIVDRYLSQHEVQLAYAAMDVLFVLQYRRANLSANLLKAMNYDKPIIADNFGYTGMMLSRFELGFTCAVEDVKSIETAMLSAVDVAETYQPTAHTARLKAFHSTENFANTLLSDVLGAKARLPVKTWEWVCEGLPKD